MSRSEQILAGLEHQKAAGEPLIELKRKALRLAENTDFREIILDNFCVKDCARFAQESGDPTLSVQERADAMAMAQASGHLRRYLRVILQQAEQFENNRAELDERIEAIRSGEESFDEDEDTDEVDDR